MARHTTFRFCLDPTVEQHDVLARHAGAARFAFNQCLRAVKTSLSQRQANPDVDVPWTGFDLINTFNRWKKTEDAGRVFVVDTNGVANAWVTGLVWRTQVCQQVFEEAAVDCGRALAAWSDSRSGKRTGRRVGFPRFKKKKKAESVPSFRLRNKHRKGRPPAIRVGDNGRARSITLPGIGVVAVHDDTRRVRRMLDKDRAKILFATISRRGGRWWLSLNIEAADLHPAHHHAPRDDGDHGGWIGVDRGLSAFLVAATTGGREVARICDPPRALAAGMKRQRQLAKWLSRKQKGSLNRRRAAARLGRHHHHVANVRRHFLHQVSNELVKTHDRLAIEDLNVSGMLRNHRLARAISDAGWVEFARLLGYKQRWRGGAIVTADRWYPSSKRCPACGSINNALSLADRVFTCGCGHAADRDTNAAVNLGHWAENHHRTPDPQAGGRPPTLADGTALTSTPCVPVKPARKTREPTFTAHPPPEPTTPEKGGAEQYDRSCSTRFIVVGMCRNITELRGLEPAATDEEIEAAARQYVRKVSGVTRPSAGNVEAFEAAVAEITATTTRLLSTLPPRRQPPKTVPPLRRPEVRARMGA